MYPTWGRPKKPRPENLSKTPVPRNKEPEFILTPSGLNVLHLPNGRPPPVHPTSQIECPSRPRLRHFNSLVDATEPSPIFLDDEDHLQPVVKRMNPCQICNVSVYHGALNYAIAITGIHIFLLCYLTYAAINSKQYAGGLLQFRDENANLDSEEARRAGQEVHVSAIVGCVVETLQVFMGVLLLFGLANTNRKWCYIWCIGSSGFVGIAVLGVTYISIRLSMILFIPVPFFLLLHAFGLWVIVVFHKVRTDPLRCPICHQIVEPNHLTKYVSDRSLPMSDSPSSPMEALMLPLGETPFQKVPPEDGNKNSQKPA